MLNDIEEIGERARASNTEIENAGSTVGSEKVNKSLSRLLRCAPFVGFPQALIALKKSVKVGFQDVGSNPTQTHWLANMQAPSAHMSPHNFLNTAPFSSQLAAITQSDLIANP